MAQSSSQPNPTLMFHQGTLVLKNWRLDPQPPRFIWDPRSRQWRAKALHYREIVQWLKGQQVKCIDLAKQFSTHPIALQIPVQLRPYQKEAISAWREAGRRGSICLPTGAGKSWVALEIIAGVRQNTLVILPTLALMQQWHDLLTNAFQQEIGELGGGKRQLCPITVSTYDSAYRHMDYYGDRFALLVFDEVHHLPAESYRAIAELSLAPFRLGLTATYARPDGLHGILSHLVGPLVYEKSIKDLEGEYLSEFLYLRISVNLTPAEKREYNRNRQIYEAYIRERKITFHGRKLDEFLMQSGRDRAGRKAFLARLQARRIIVEAREKMRVLEKLLALHKKDRVLIFTANTHVVYHISRAFLVPAITHHTGAEERQAILARFRAGTFRVLAASRALNEGVDIPEANVAIVLSGSASPVEHLQRLGRILRKSGDTHATLYEIVTRGTGEGQISYQRRQSDAYR